MALCRIHKKFYEQITSKMMSGEALSEEDRANIKRYGIQLRERPTRFIEKPKEDCPDGVHCEQFEQITEGELLEGLRNGWQIVHRLTNGEVIVKR